MIFFLIGRVEYVRCCIECTFLIDDDRGLDQFGCDREREIVDGGIDRGSSHMRPDGDVEVYN